MVGTSKGVDKIVEELRAKYGEVGCAFSSFRFPDMSKYAIVQKIKDIGVKEKSTASGVCSVGSHGKTLMILL